jgi:DNA-binding NtrC family response regulator
MESRQTVPTERRVLIVDDEINMRKTLAEILRDEGFSIATAGTGEEAVALCREQRFEVVLMDVRMPGMSGVEAFRQIRRHQEGVRVILMSAYSIEDLKEAALDEGAIAFLSKPLDLDQVISLVAEVHDTTILVVESDDDTAALLRENLSQRGYRVTIAESSHDALELVEQIRFDLVFLDTDLPVMNGLELYLAIKRITPSAVAIMIAGMEQEFERIAREAVRRNAYTVIRKPLDIDRVLQLLRRVTGRQASGDSRKPPLPESW